MNVIHRQHLPPSGVEFSCQASPDSIHLITLFGLFELCLTDDDDFENNHLRNHEENKNKRRSINSSMSEDGLDRLLVSFQDAKMTLLEWSNPAADLVPISLHTFEKLPQITQGDLPRDFQAQLEINWISTVLVSSGGLNSALNPEQQRSQSLPYASSFILDFNQQLLNHLPPVLENQQRPIKSVIALKFLPGFSEPTLANLPYDAHGLVACPKELAVKVLVLCADMILHVDQSSKIIGVATNGWIKPLYLSSKSRVKCWLTLSSRQTPNVAHLLSNNLERGEDLEDGEEQER
ncbi:hypothetical protein Pst134EA_032653 [Puccinia striiformis f. sp. tritici]|uniref:uncharacterized protein n=1 Tax=Puccinia striiformis f. sp. tritici TaxID=168172 RepID=UPI0020075E3F|nr:uncharacterized protein Pst134EA_032653 [Puccinia striiformis f. sp. tritici]KAH9443463.1 hypothetical protein Pst134EA_032653 [Puccinia striiformis f. sp. tritici]